MQLARKGIICKNHIQKNERNILKIDIEINIEDPLWQKIIGIEEDYFSTEDTSNQDYLSPTIKLLQEITNKVMANNPPLASFDVAAVSLLLTNDERITDLNSQHRSKHKATNVLSFPENEFISPGRLEETIDGDYLYLGDIAMSYQTIKSQAEEKSIGFADHFLHLYVHSLLHLIGYDHAVDEEADVMQSIEVEILSHFGIKSPYE